MKTTVRIDRSLLVRIRHFAARNYLSVRKACEILLEEGCDIVTDEHLRQVGEAVTVPQPMDFNQQMETVARQRISNGDHHPRSVIFRAALEAALQRNK